MEFRLWHFRLRLLSSVGPSQIKSSEVVDIKFCACNFLRYKRDVDFVCVPSFSGFSIVNLELLLYSGVYEGSRVSERCQQLIVDGLQVIPELCKVSSVQTLIAIL